MDSLRGCCVRGNLLVVHVLQILVVLSAFSRGFLSVLVLVVLLDSVLNLMLLHPGLIEVLWRILLVEMRVLQVLAIASSSLPDMVLTLHLKMEKRCTKGLG